MASAVGIVDAGGYYAADEVEGALQEIGGAHSEGRQNGVVTGFGYSAAGLVVTFASPSTALVPTLRDYSGESITLPDITPSVWVYIDPNTGVITQVSAVNPPNITTPENLLLWQFTTSAGAITGARDARLYVRNLDRKLPFTVRASGAQADQESEACFVTLDAALVYLQYSVPLNGLRTEVVIRGPVTTGPIDLPVDGIQFRGEDGATVTLTSGAYLFDLKGRAGISFSGLTLATNVVGATAIVDSVGAPPTPTSTPLSLSRCVFTAGTDPWDAGVDLASAGRFTVTSCRLTVVQTGISVVDPLGVLVEGTEVSAINFIAGSMGIRLGNPPVTTPSSVAMACGCTVTGFDIGVSIVGEAPTVTGCKVFPGTNATVGIIVGPSTDAVVSGNLVDCDQNAGLVGLRADASSADITGLKVTNNTFFGARAYGIDLQGSVQESVVSGNVIDCNDTSNPNDPAALAGIYVHVAGAPTRVPSYLTVSGNVVWRARTGIVLEGGGVTTPILEVAATGNVVHHCAVGVAGSPTTLFETSTGIGAVHCAGLNLSANEVYGIGAILTDAGAVVQPTPADVYANGVYLQYCTSSAVVGNRVADLQPKGGGKVAGIYSETPGSVTFSATGVRIAENQLSSVPGGGILVSAGANAAALTSTLTGWAISGNTLVQTDNGITLVVDGRATATDFRIESNTVTVASNRGIDVSVIEAAVGVPPGVVAGIQVVDNTIHDPTASAIRLRCQNGTSANQVSIDRNVVRLPQSHGIEISVGVSLGAGPALFEDVSVSGNNLAMAGSVATDAISWNSVASSIDNVRIDDNFITDAVDGVDLGAVGSGSPAINTTLSNFTFRGNKIVASGRGFIGNVSGHVNLFEASSNDVVASGGVFALAPIATAPAVTSSFDLTFSRNKFSSLAGANTRLQFADMKVNGVRFEGNLLRGGDAASVGGLQVIVSGSDTGLLPSVRNLHVSNNTFRNMDCAGVALSVAGPTDPIVDTVLSNNTFEAVATDVATTRASVVRFDAGAVVRNLKVCGNQVLASGHSTATHGGFDFTLAGGSGLDFSDNQFNVSSGAASNTYGNIVNLNLTTSPGALLDVSVCRNKSRGVTTPAGATTPALIALDLRTATEVSNLVVCDNDLDRIDNGSGNTAGVRLWADATVFRTAIDRNRVTGVSVGATALSLTLDAGAEGFSVCGNHVSGDAVSGATGAGIGAYFGQTSVAVRVCDNNITGDTTSGSGISVQTDVGAALNNSFIEQNFVRDYETNIRVQYGNCINLSVSGNQTSSHAVTGIEVQGQGTGTAANLSVDGNRVSTQTASQSYFVRAHMTGTGEYENLSVCDNDGRYTGLLIASGDGIHVESATAGSTRMVNAHICRNRVLSVEYGIRVGSGTTTNVRIDDNNVRDVNGGIDHELKGNTTGYSVSGNAVGARTDSTVTGLIYIYHDAAGYNFQEVTVDGNMVGGAISVAGSTHGGDAGIRVSAPLKAPDARSVSISNNQVRKSKSGIVASFASASSVSVDANKVTSTSANGVNVGLSTNGTIGDTIDVSVSGNSVSYWCESGAGNAEGIKLFVGTNLSNFARGITMANNNCHTDQNTAVAYYIYLAAEFTFGFVFANNIGTFPGPLAPTGTTALDLYTFGTLLGGTYKNFVFTGNVFRGSSNGIIYTGVALGPRPDRCTFMGNIGDSAGSWSQFANLSTAGWTNVLPDPIATFQNFNIDDGT
jgi:hypothetical protein